jgi:glycosyltransferase involved in cell wall biosynthesis
MAAVARQTADARHLPAWRIAVADTSRTTAPDRRLAQAVRAHVRRFAGLVAALLHDRPRIAHIHTCSYNTFLRTMPDILICRLAGAKIVLHVHGGYFDAFLRGLRGLRLRIVRGHLRLCHRILILGETWRRRLDALVPGLPLEILPNAVATASFAARSRIRSSHCILFVGDLARAKGIDDLIQAVAAFPADLRTRVKLCVVGDGTPERRNALNDQVWRLGLADRVTFHGSLPPAGMHRVYACASVFALPSYGEGLPVSLLEAMAAGLPSVATDVGAIPEALRDNVDGWLVARGDIVGLTDRLIRLLQDPSTRRSMGRSAARRAAMMFDESRFFVRLHEIWHATLGGIDPAADVPEPAPTDAVPRPPQPIEGPAIGTAAVVGR